MNSKNPKYVEARKMRVQRAIDEISKVQNFSNSTNELSIKLPNLVSN